MASCNLNQWLSKCGTSTTGAGMGNFNAGRWHYLNGDLRHKAAEQEAKIKVKELILDIFVHKKIISRKFVILLRYYVGPVYHSKSTKKLSLLTL